MKRMKKENTKPTPHNSLSKIKGKYSFQFFKFALIASIRRGI
jgi:hypothetical protein